MSASFLLAIAPFVLAPCVAALWTGRRSETADGDRGWALAVGTAPAAFFAFVAALLWFLPGLPGPFYVASPLVLTVGLLLWGLRRRSREREVQAGAPWRRLSTGVRASLALAAIVTVSAPLSPLVESDPLDYSQAGRTVAEARNLRAYPVLDSPSGFYGPWTHGPLFATIFAWDALVGRPRENPMAGPVAGGWFFFALATLMAIVSGRRGAPAAMAPLVFVATPLFAVLAASAHIETLRVFLVTASLVAFGETLRNGEKGWAVATAGLFTLMLYAHSATVLCFAPAAAVGWLWRRNKGARPAFVAASAAFVLWIPWGIRNTLLLGSPIADMGTGSLFDHPAVRYFETLRRARGIDTAWERLVFGVLGPWTLFEFFGLVAWIAAAVMIIRTSRKQLLDRCRNDAALAALALGPLLYGAGAVVSAPLGIELFIQNARYPMTFLAGWAVLASLATSLSHRLVGKVLVALLVGAACVSAARVVAVVGIRRTNVFPTLAEKDRFSARKAIRAAESALPATAKVLTFRQSEWGVYGKLKFVCHYHPSMRPVYDASSPTEARAALDRLGIDALAVPIYYSVPFFAETHLAALAGDASETELLYADDEWAVFRLVHRPTLAQPLVPKVSAGGKPRWARRRIERTLLRVPEPQGGTDLETGRTRLTVDPRGAHPANTVAYLEGNAQWVVTDASAPVTIATQIHGDSLAGLTIIEESDAGTRELPLWKGLLDEAPREIRAQRILRPNARFHLRYEVLGRGSLEADAPSASVAQ